MIPWRMDSNNRHLPMVEEEGKIEVGGDITKETHKDIEIQDHIKEIRHNKNFRDEGEYQKRLYNKSKYQCYYCKKYGHFANKDNFTNTFEITSKSMFII
jgi:hypothetical protein